NSVCLYRVIIELEKTVTIAIGNDIEIIKRRKALLRKKIASNTMNVCTKTLRLLPIISSQILLYDYTKI
ncbi:MAG: hypothetical protein QXD57_03120, partial [Ignisphaera sp.]